MPTPNADQLAQFLGEQSPTFDSEDRLNAIIGICKAWVSSYTRGEGFTDGEPADDLAAVILTMAARIVANPSQTPIRQQLGAVQVDIRSGPVSPSLLEWAVLNNYRVRAK